MWGVRAGHLLKVKITFPPTIVVDGTFSLGRVLDMYFLEMRSTTVFELEEENEMVTHRAGGLGVYSIALASKARNKGELW